MNKTEYLLFKLAEEAAELAKAASKAARFGIHNHHPDTPQHTNEDDIIAEFTDICAVFDILTLDKDIRPFDCYIDEVAGPEAQMRKFARVSVECGTLQHPGIKSALMWEPVCEACDDTGVVTGGYCTKCNAAFRQPGEPFALKEAKDG